MTTQDFIKTVAYHALSWGVECAEATYDLCRLALQRGIPGDFVECGVYAGASSALMARAILDYDTEKYPERPSSRRVHLFDSFEGMPTVDPTRDPELYGSYGEKCKGSAKCSLPQVQAKMHEWGVPAELLVYHPGWFQQTIPIALAMREFTAQVAERDSVQQMLKAIAVLRIDCDSYESTKLVMKHLYPLVARGGWVIGDDYDLKGERDAVNEVVNPAPMYWRKR